MPRKSIFNKNYCGKQGPNFSVSSQLNGSSKPNPLDFAVQMASLNPRTTPEQKEAASALQQLFAPQGNDFSYHGLNFAAYGGKVNKFDGESGSSILNNRNTLLNDEDFVRNNWRWANIDELQDDDPLYKTIDPTDVKWITDSTGRLVPKSTVMNWVNSYERQTPYQAQNDVAEEGWLKRNKLLREANWRFPSYLTQGIPKSQWDNVKRRFWDVYMRGSAGAPDGYPDNQLIAFLSRSPVLNFQTIDYVLSGND